MPPNPGLMNSSPRPRANPRNAATASTGTGRNGNRSGPQGSQGGSGEGVLAYIRSLRPTPAPPPQTDRPTTPIVEPDLRPPQPRDPDIPPPPPSRPNPDVELPDDRVEARRGERRADRTLIDALRSPGTNRSSQSYRGTVLSSVYRLPADGQASARTLQQFNGPRGQRMTLGN
jgi:hypothetical protein